MKLSKSLDCPGFFWLPNKPNELQPGILCISELGDVELRITSLLDIDHTLSLENNDSQFGIIGSHGINKRYERIVGIVKLNNSSQLVTLEDCLCTGSSAPPSEGVSSAKFVVRIAYFGVNYDANEEIKFSKVTFSVEWLDEWLGSSGFKVEDCAEESNNRSNTIVKYSRPAEIRFALPNSEFELRINYDFVVSEKLSSVEAYQRANISLVSKSLRPINEFENLIYKIELFLSFAIDDGISLESMRAYSDEKIQHFSNDQTQMIPIHVYYKSVPRTKPKLKVSWPRMLFSYNKISGNFEQIVTQWMGACEKYEPAFDLFSDAMFRPSIRLEVNFLLLIHGIEVLHRRGSSETEFDEQKFKRILAEVIKSVPLEFQNLFKRKLEYPNEISLRKRLKEMFQPFSEYFKFDKDLKSFINRTLDTRNYLTHFDKDLEYSAAKGTDLFVLNRKLEALFQLHFLRIIGMDSTQFEDIVTNNYLLQIKLGNQIP